MVNSTTNTSADIPMNGENLEKMTSFKYKAPTRLKDGISITEVRKLLPWQPQTKQVVDKFHQLPNQVKALQVPRSLHPIYGFKIWTLLTDTEQG
ncbi:hypothetical protein DPMN_059023 [Dreissena polymorpha]|uniref:Uncharacterized protein n=1 Tax=Dreissena polymorpha TaxID=45954 RepID=A0A9D4C2T5_DREPO|nr:hypothetical protein DPMN_059023 [Dreissena polymorpha]